jgi:hypothetical protein
MSSIAFAVAIVCLVLLAVFVVGFHLWNENRRPAPSNRSAIWVVQCDEKFSEAIVVVHQRPTSSVSDCSCWATSPGCGKSCLAQIRAGERVRESAQP